MKTVTLSTRLSKEEARKVSSLAKELGLDRSALLKQMIRNQVGQLLVKQACERYREGAISISKAAEEADLSLRDFLLQLETHSIGINYGLKELQTDLECD